MVTPITSTVSRGIAIKLETPSGNMTVYEVSIVGDWDNYQRAIKYIVDSVLSELDAAILTVMPNSYGVVLSATAVVENLPEFRRITFPKAGVNVLPYLDAAIEIAVNKMYTIEATLATIELSQGYGFNFAHTKPFTAGFGKGGLINRTSDYLYIYKNNKLAYYDKMGIY